LSLPVRPTDDAGETSGCHQPLATAAGLAMTIADSTAGRQRPSPSRGSALTKRGKICVELDRRFLNATANASTTATR
jgi:hypothetical protein